MALVNQSGEVKMSRRYKNYNVNDSSLERIGAFIFFIMAFCVMLIPVSNVKGGLGCATPDAIFAEVIKTCPLYAKTNQANDIKKLLSSTPPVIKAIPVTAEQVKKFNLHWLTKTGYQVIPAKK